MNELYNPIIKELAMKVMPNDDALEHIDPDVYTEVIGEDSCRICRKDVANDIKKIHDKRLRNVSVDEIMDVLPEIMEGEYHG